MGRKEDSFNEWKDLLCTLSQQASSIGIGVFGTDGVLQEANQTMCYFLDTDPEELRPRNSFVNPEFSTFLGVEDGLVFSGLMTLGDYAQTSYVLQTKVFRRDRRLLVYAEPDATDLFEGNKKMSHLNQEVNNLQRQLIKEKKQLQMSLAALKETQQMLVHSEKMNALGKLVAGLAHEVNNPIAFVYSNLFSTGDYVRQILDSLEAFEQNVEQYGSGLLKQVVRDIRKKNDLDFIEEDILQMLKESRMGVERVKALVEDLRRFSRLDEADQKRVDLVENLRSTLAIVRPEMVARKINLTFQAPEELPLLCYPGQLNQAILNILMNAIQAVDEGGKISVSVSVRETSVLIRIEDNGCGIPEAVKSRIFEPFFTTKPVGSGTGLGLSITYKIVHDLHKGRIDVFSLQDGGTAFEIVLPVH